MQKKALIVFVCAVAAGVAAGVLRRPRAHASVSPASVIRADAAGRIGSSRPPAPLAGDAPAPARDSRLAVPAPPAAPPTGRARKPRKSQTAERPLRPSAGTRRGSAGPLTDRGGDADGGERAPKAPPSAEALAAWTFVPGSSISPGISPPLRSLAPAARAGTQPRTVENERLPYRGTRPGDAAALADGALQRGFGVNAPTPTGVAFPGIGVNGSAPSDDNGRVGPNHYVQTVNSQFAVFSKSGGAPLFGPANINTLFASVGGPCAAQNDGDPIVQYDVLADRWVISEFAVDAPPTGLASYQCMAISATGDPLGSYFLYPFPLSPILFFDYPHVATWLDAYYATFHVFDETQPIDSQYQNQGLVVFEREAMLEGAPARLQVTSVGPAGAATYFGGLAADLDGMTPPPAGSPEYLVAPGSLEFDGSASPRLHFFRVSSVWGATPSVTITGPTEIATASFNANLCDFSRDCLPQPAPSDNLDALPGELMWRLAYRNRGGMETLLAQHTVNALSPPAKQAAIRWYEIRTPAATPTLFQQGTFAPDSNDRWAGSIAMDEAGNMALGYSKTSTSVKPEIDVTGRLAADAPGTMGAEIVMQAGIGVQNSTGNRWGDYSSMAVDARDGCTFWYTTQYIPVTGAFTWSTRIGAFTFGPANCSPPAHGSLSGTVTDVTGNPIAGAVVKVDNGYSGATDALGAYRIELPAGSVTAIATAPRRPGCASSSSAPVAVSSGSSTVQNFVLNGTVFLALGPVGLGDSGGNANGHVNRNECLVLDLPLDNLGCAVAGNASAVLSSSTPGVTVTQGTASYGTIATGARADNAPSFAFATDASLVCGSPIQFLLTVTSSAGTTPLTFSIPTCDAPFVANGSIVAGDPVQTARLFRSGTPSTCGSPTACAGPSSTGTRHFDAYAFTNTASTSRCVTVDLAPSCSEPSSPIFSAAYLGAYDPANLCTRFLADGGVSPDNGGHSSYSFDVPAGAAFTVTVNEIGMNTFCSAYALTVSGLDDTSSGGRPSAAIAASSSVCAGSAGNAASVANAGPGATYAWTITGGTITAGAGTRSITYTAGGSGSVVLGTTVTSGGGCAATSQATIPITACPAGKSYFTVPACRLLDTRTATGPFGGPALTGGSSRAIPAAGQCGIPAGATAVAVNVTVTRPGAAGYLTLFPTGTSVPLASFVNFRPGQTRASNAIVPLSDSGSLSIFCGMASGSTDVILDVGGYFQ